MGKGEKERERDWRNIQNKLSNVIGNKLRKTVNLVKSNIHDENIYELL